MIPLGLLLLVFLFVYSCVPDPIRDLRLLEVRRLPASALPRGDDLREPLMRRGEAIWKLTLEGDAGWIGEVRQHELNSYAKVVRCDKPDYTLLALGPYVGPVAITFYDGGFQAYRPPERGAVRYDIYVPEAGRYHTEADFNASAPAYDLSRERLAICLRIAGGAMHGAYNRSNEVRTHIGRRR